MMSDMTADFLARVKNAVLGAKKEVEVVKTNMVVSILDILKREEFIQDYSVDDKKIIVSLRYDGNESVITELKKVSKPGQRIYTDYKSLKPVVNGRGIGIISTSQGLMTVAQAKSKKLGGEYICQIW